MPDLHEHSDAFARLPQESKMKISTALKGMIEKELASAGPSNASNYDRQHDRGPLFGKDFDRQSKDLEELAKLHQMDEEKFKVFTERLAALRGSK